MAVSIDRVSVEDDLVGFTRERCSQVFRVVVGGRSYRMKLAQKYFRVLLDFFTAVVIMGDVADILGFSNKKNQNEEALRFFDDKPKNAFKKAVIKPKGMSREVYKLQGWNTMLPAVGATSLPAGYKEKRQAAAKGIRTVCCSSYCIPLSPSQ